MKLNNLHTLRNKIVKIFLIFLLTSIAISAVLFLYIFCKNKKDNELLFVTQVRNANQVLQYSMYSQINLLLSNPDFLSFVFAGDLSRERHYGNIILLCSNLDHDLFRGIEVVKFNPISKNGVKILNYGNPTKNFINLDICYLNNSANDILGDCVFKHINFKIYFSQTAYIKQLNSINQIIEAATNEKIAYKFYPFHDQLVNIRIKNHSINPLLLSFNPDNKSNTDLLLLVIPFFSIMLFVCYFGYNTIRKEVENKLIIPLDTISENLKKNASIPTNANYLIELNNLVNIVNKYHITQINDKLNQIAARLAHDIQSPLACKIGS